MIMESCGASDMKKKAAKEALNELISHMSMLEGGQKHEMAESPQKEDMEESMNGGNGGGSIMEKMASQGMPTDRGTGDMTDEMDAERKDFMSYKKKPMLEKSVTVVMASPKMKKKMRG